MLVLVFRNQSKCLQTLTNTYKGFYGNSWKLCPMADRQTLNKKHHDNNFSNRSHRDHYPVDSGKEKTENNY